jgi:hypothetical protein
MGIFPAFSTDTAKEQYTSVVNNAMGGMNEIKTDPPLHEVFHKN